jgi:ribosomal protein S18 acetylase RimI-like enzyme
VQSALTRTDPIIRARIEDYYDAVPRTSALVEEFGSLRLFIRSTAGSPYYGRPAPESDRPVAADEVGALLARQRELWLPESLEWVDETTPDLAAVALEVGLEVRRHPLMIFDASAPVAPVRSDAARPPTIRVLTADDPALAGAIAAAHLAFDEPGGRIGLTGRVELNAKVAELELELDGWLSALAERIRGDQAVVAAAFDEDGIAVSSGQHNPIGPTTEIVGVGTVASARRRGHAQAVTARLVAEAQSRDITTIFLSAGDDDVARIYSRIGFRRIGTAMIAEPRNGANRT